LLIGLIVSILNTHFSAFFEQPYDIPLSRFWPAVP